MICLGVPMSVHADVVLQERPSDTFSLVDGSVRKGKIVGDKLFIVGLGGKLEAAADGRYRGGDGRMIVVIGGKIAQQPGVNTDPGAQKGIVVQQGAKAPMGQ